MRPPDRIRRLRGISFLFIFALLFPLLSITQNLKADSIWKEYFQGTILATYSGFLTNDQRGSTYLKLGYDQRWKNVRLKISTRYLTNSLVINYDILEDGKATGKITSFTKRESTDYLSRLFRETYIKFYLSEYVNLSIGKHVITFGQFDFISPIDFVLPFDISDRSIKFTKQENRLPQTSLILSFFTKSQTEIEFIYFPIRESDSIISILSSSPTLVTPNQKYDRENKLILFKPLYVPVFPIFLKDQQQYALRIIQYDEDITYGFTFFLGPSQFPSTYKKILPDSDGDGLFLFNTIMRQDRGDTLGFELAKLVGDFEVKFEIALSNFFYPGLAEFGDHSGDVEFVNDKDYYNNNHIFEGKGQEIIEYMNWIMNNNEGRLYANGSQYLVGIGFDYDTKDWFCNLTFLIFYRVINSRFNEAIRLKENAFPSSVTPFSGVNIRSLTPLPTVNFFRRYSYGIIEYQVGFGLGILGAGVGFSQYHIIKYKDDLKFIIAFEALGLFSSIAARIEANATFGDKTRTDALLPEGPDGTIPFIPTTGRGASLAESNGFVTPSIRIGISYIF